MNVNAVGPTQKASLGAYESLNANGEDKKFSTILKDSIPKQDTDIKALLDKLTGNEKDNSDKSSTDLRVSNSGYSSFSTYV